MIKGELIDSEQLPMQTGVLTLEQVNLILKHLPVELSFIDEKEIIRYYNKQDDKLFAREPDIIGHIVQDCHAPESHPAIGKMLDAFRNGERDMSELWIMRDKKFIHIRYFALRDSEGKFKGCLEVVQDITKIRKLRGQRKADW